MRWTKRLFQCLSTSTLVAAAAVLVAGGIGCADETFKCCECSFVAPAECVPTDPNLMPASIRFCGCPADDTFTYEECGVFCKSEFPAVFAVFPAETGAVSDPPLTCTPGKTPIVVAPDPEKTFAKNSCSVGSPVGE